MRKDKKIREYIFWILDRINGSPIKKAFRKTISLMNSSDIINNQDESLKKLLNHAVLNTEYYKELGNGATIEDFPLINKNIIRDNLSQFTSSKFNIDRCKEVSTSGSTGTPFSVCQNKGKVHKNIADNIFFSSKSNYRVGDHLVYIKIWPDKFCNKELLNFKIRNIQPHSVYNLSNEDIDALINKLNTSKKRISFIGYASAFEKICWYLDRKKNNPIKFKTSSIITISESLNTYTRSAIKHHFGITPLSRYSNSENGIIAQQMSPNDLKFRINDSSYKVEIFDLHEDRKIGYKKRGRIVITDLYNYATPLIRYDTGDVGIMNLDAQNKPYFTEILGRKLDLLYDTEGNLVPEHISARLCNYGYFKQFQLIQKHRKEYLINLNTEKKVDEEKMISEYKGYFGADASININYVDEIPLLQSGKRQEVVNEYYNSTYIND